MEFRHPYALHSPLVTSNRGVHPSESRARNRITEPFVFCRVRNRVSAPLCECVLSARYPIANSNRSAPYSDSSARNRTSEVIVLCTKAPRRSLSTGVRGRGQPVEKLHRALLCPWFGDRIRRFRSVLDLFSRTLGEPTGPTTTFSTRWGLLEGLLPESQKGLKKEPKKMHAPSKFIGNSSAYARMRASGRRSVCCEKSKNIP